MTGIPSIEEFIAAKNAGKLSICAKCRVPITILTDQQGNISVAHGQSYRHHDHEPVPIIVEDTVDYASDCDFCGVRSEMHWTFEGNNVSIPTVKGVDPRTGDPIVQTNDLGHRWSACAICGPMVRDGDVENLLNRLRSVGRMYKKTPPEHRAELIAAWRKMWGDYFASIHKVDYHGPTTEPARLNPRLMPKIQEGLSRFWTSEDWGDSLLEAAGRVHPFQFPGLVADREDLFEIKFPPGQKWPRWMWMRHGKHLSTGVRAADLYWISGDFTQLAIMAGKDFEKIEVHRDDLPSPHGVMVFEEPIGVFKRGVGDVHVTGVTWTLVPDGVWINLYCQPEEGTRPSEVDILTLRTRIGFLMCPNPGIGIKFGQSFDAPAPEEPDFVLTILATWFLINQPGVVTISEAPVDKKQVRAAARAGKRLPPVKLVDLRRRPTRTTSATHVGRPLKVRVYRSGHWKNQAYGPKRGMRRHIYISPYIAGPEGAPLKERTPTVKVLR